MEWQPIETYDKLKEKPALAVFWFEAVPAKCPGGFGLDACANLSRIMGSRVCTHWFSLPELPSNAGGNQTQPGR